MKTANVLPIHYHEAGHAVAGCVLYDIAGAAETDDLGGHATTHRPTHIRRRSRLHRMVAAAGAVATALAAGRVRPGDDDYMCALVDIWGVGGWSDRVEEETITLLTRYWAAVEAVAQVLSERGRAWPVDVMVAVVAVEDAERVEATRASGGPNHAA